MLYIKENVTENRLKEYGFKRCKKPYNQLLYLCVSRGCSVIFIGKGIFVQDWDNNDPRIHSTPNCKYRSQKTSLDIIYNLIKDGLVEERIV